VPRVDIPAKASGTYMHMQHAWKRVLRNNQRIFEQEVTNRVTP